MLERLSGKTHTVVSGLCLLTAGWEVVEHEETHVTFRELTPRELAHNLAHGEWDGRAGAYAIQGRGAALVERIEGDYLNVVGLPAALLVRLLAERFPGAYGFLDRSVRRIGGGLSPALSPGRRGAGIGGIDEVAEDAPSRLQAEVARRPRRRRLAKRNQASTSARSRRRRAPAPCWPLAERARVQRHRRRRA